MDKPEEQNPMQGKMVRFVEDDSEKKNADGVRGHLEAIGPSCHKAGVYEAIIKDPCRNYSYIMLV